MEKRNNGEFSLIWFQDHPHLHFQTIEEIIKL